MNKKKIFAYLVLATSLAGWLGACNHEKVVPSAGSINFGEVYVGLSANSAAVSWTNNDNNPIDTVGLLLAPLGGPFSFQPGPFAGQTVPAGQSTRAYTFTFTPTQEGQVTGDASLQISGMVPVRNVQLRGIGVIQMAKGDLAIGSGDLRPGQVLDFGSVPAPGGAPMRRTFRVSNTGNAAHTFNVSWAGSSNAYRIVSPVFPVLLQPGQKVDIVITFTPPAVGQFNAGVTFTDTVNPAHATGTALTGQGVPGG